MSRTTETAVRTRRGRQKTEGLATTTRGNRGRNSRRRPTSPRRRNWPLRPPCSTSRRAAFPEARWDDARCLVGDRGVELSFRVVNDDELSTHIGLCSSSTRRQPQAVRADHGWQEPRKRQASAVLSACVGSHTGHGRHAARPVRRAKWRHASGLREIVHQVGAVEEQLSVEEHPAVFQEQVEVMRSQPLHVLLRETRTKTQMEAEATLLVLVVEAPNRTSDGGVGSEADLVDLTGVVVVIETKRRSLRSR